MRLLRSWLNVVSTWVSRTWLAVSSWVSRTWLAASSRLSRAWLVASSRLSRTWLIVASASALVVVVAVVAVLVSGGERALVFSITPEKSQLLLGEPLRLQLRVENPSSSPVSGVFQFTFNSGILFLFTAPEGAEFQRFFSQLAPLRSDATITSDTLEPGGVVEGSLTVSYGVSTSDWIFPTSGSYQLKATLIIDPLDFEQALESEVVTVAVVDPTGADADALAFILANNLKPFLTTEAEGFLGLEEAVPKLGELLDTFPTSTYQPYILEALAPLAGLFPELLMIPPEVLLRAEPQVGAPPLTVTFTAEAQKQRGVIEEYRWDFDGDGLADETTTEATIARTFDQQGTFIVSVVVIDNTNLTAVDSRIVATTPGFHLGFEPLALVLDPGEAGEFRVAVVPVGQSLSAVAMEVTFDPAIVQVLSVEPGDLLGADPLVALRSIDNVNGVVTLALARKGATPVPSPGGGLVSIRLQVASTATSGTSTAIDFRAVQLVDAGLNLVSAEEIVYQGQLLIGIP